MTRKLIQFDDIPTCVTSNLIKVVGVGGGGCNAVRNMYDEGIKDVAFAVANTDSMVLEKSPVAVKVLLGDSGLGAGGNPEVGKEEQKRARRKSAHCLTTRPKWCLSQPRWVEEQERGPVLWWRE